MDELLSTRAIARRLTEEGIPTSRGAVQWQPTAVSRMLTNPVYKGSYRYRQLGQEEILIPVPPLVEVVTWQAAQVQLLANSQYSRRNNGRHQYLLRGLMRSWSRSSSRLGSSGVVGCDQRDPETPGPG